MKVDDAFSLAGFINDQSTRFSARVLTFSDQGWVIVADAQTNLFNEPIADTEDYLKRADNGLISLETSYSNVLREWVEVRSRL